MMKLIGGRFLSVAIKTIKSRKGESVIGKKIGKRSDRAAKREIMIGSM